MVAMQNKLQLIFNSHKYNIDKDLVNYDQQKAKGQASWYKN